MFMKNALLACVATFFFQFVNAQQQVIDSLEQVLSKIEDDSLKTQKSVEFINFYRHRDSDMHLYVLTKLLKESVEDGNERLQSKWIDEKALYHRIQGNIDSSLVFSEKALEIGEKLQDFRLINNAKTSLSTAYQSKGDYSKAIKLSLEMLKDHEDVGKEDEKNYLIIKYNLSGAYYDMEEYHKSLDLVEALYNNPKVKQDNEFLSEVCLQIAAVNYQLDETDDAIIYGKQAESIEKRPYLKAMIYNVLSSLYNEKGDYEKTNEYLKKSLPIFEDMGDQIRIIATKQNIGNNSMYLGEYDLAVQQLKEVETLLSKEKHPNLANLEVNY